MAITITTIASMIIVQFSAYLFRSCFFKMKVRPEFDSKAVELLFQRRFVKHDPALTEKEKFVELLVIELETDKLLDTVIKDNYNQKD